MCNNVLPPDGIEALEARLAQDMRWLNLPAKDWVHPRTIDGETILDVAIIGGGLCGLAAAAALRRVGIYRLAIYDRAPQGREGPWITYARMETLRTRKEVSGPALGIPSLTFRAWFEAQFGVRAWEEMDKIPRVMWMDYMIWYRRVLALPVENETEIVAVEPRADGMLVLTLVKGGVRRIVIARRVVLATGLDGLGGPLTPSIARHLDRRFWAHGADPIDFAALKGKRVGVVGAGASAMDNAATALEARAKRVDLFVRRPRIPSIDKFTGVGSPGMVHGYVGLPRELKWRFQYLGNQAQIPPPRPSTLRVSRFPNAHFHLGSPLLSAVPSGDGIEVTTPKGRYELDFLIFTTGFGIDLSRRPDLAALAPHVRLWNDSFTPPSGEESEELGKSPDLGPAFELQEKTPGVCPAVNHVTCFAYPSLLTQGKLTSGIPSISDGALRLSRGIARSIFVEDGERHFADFVAYNEPELIGDEYVDADLTQERIAAHGTG